MKVAVVGATGVVGETILRVLEERNLSIERLGAFASRARSAAVRFRGEPLDVYETSQEALRQFDVILFASGEDASERYAPALVASGCVVVDNSSTFRMNDGVPLIVPEINADALRCEHRLFPVANCTAIVLCMALAPIRNVAGLRSVQVATYQAASGAGRAGLEELEAEQRAAALGQPEPEPRVFSAPLAYNVVPKIGSFDASGYTGEERKVAEETRKILNVPELFVSATCVRVPVRTAHSEAVYVETQRLTTVAELAQAFSRAPNTVFHANSDAIVTPRDVEGSDAVHVARLRAERSEPTRHFTLWCVGDQLRKGAATNAVQIVELLVEKGYAACALPS